jgi:hypothetical protein
VAKQAEWTRRTAPPEHVAAKTSKHGWFLPYLLEAEDRINGRWNYWLEILSRGTIGTATIPKLAFGMCGLTGGKQEIPYGDDVAQNHARGLCGTMAEAAANIQWAFGRAFDRGARLDDLINWWLFAFGSKTVEDKPKLEHHAEHAMYCGLELHRLLANPGDWAAHIANLYYGGRRSHNIHAWFPTPINVATMMVEMQFGGGVDYRCQTITDPCCGTGAMLLPASNYSLRLYGQDIDYTMCRLCEWQAWLYVPWLAFTVPDDRIKEFAEHDAQRLGRGDGQCEHQTGDLVLGGGAAVPADAAAVVMPAGLTSPPRQSGRPKRPAHHGQGTAAIQIAQRMLFKPE